MEGMQQCPKWEQSHDLPMQAPILKMCMCVAMPIIANDVRATSTLTNSKSHQFDGMDRENVLSFCCSILFY